MTAGILTPAAESPSGLRPVNPRRDMGQVADLIEIAFAGHMDASGRRMVREIRSLGRMGWLGWLAGLLLLPPAARPHGYVWREDDRVVGNASLLPVRGYPDRWVMANVAVHPDYRRRGIARQMVEACERLAQQAGARTVVLQVESENQAALQLYRRQGFEVLSSRTTWRRSTRLPGHPLPGAPGGIQQSRDQQWKAHFELAQRAAPEGVVWPYPLERDFFRPKRGIVHWLCWDGDQLLGGLSLRPGASARLVMVVDPSARGQLEPSLVAFGLQALGRGQHSVLLDYPAAVAAEPLRALGFNQERRLTWMRKRSGEQPYAGEDR